MRPEHRDPPPPGYVCHRCGMQGHWIYSCPTMNQAADGTGKPGMHRVKRTTGIPKSFLQKVDNLDEVGNALVTSDGTLVVATANEAAWKTAQRMSRAAVSAEDIDGSLVPEELKCNLCKKLARDAVKAPCCKTAFCSSCIESQLLEPGLMHFTCPQCRSGLVPDQLEVAKDIRGKVDEFLREFSSKNVAEENGDEPSDSANGDTLNGSANGHKPVEAASGAQVPPPATAAAATAVAATAATAPAPANIQRPPAQIPPRPRPMNVMPGMMMGGFPGMPMPMGQMPFMAGMMPPMPPNSMGQWANKASGDSAAESDKKARASRRSSSRRPRSRSRSTRRRSRSRDSRDRHARDRDGSRASRDSRSRREYSRDRSPSRRHREGRSRYRDDSRERRSSRYDDRRRRDRYRSGRSRSPASRDHSSHSDARTSRKGSRRDEEVSIRGQSTNSTDKPRNIADRLNDTRSTDTAKAQESSGSRRRRRRRR